MARIQYLYDREKDRLVRTPGQFEGVIKIYSQTTKWGTPGYIISLQLSNVLKEVSLFVKYPQEIAYFKPGPSGSAVCILYSYNHYT